MLPLGHSANFSAGLNVMGEPQEHLNVGLALALSQRYEEACQEFEAAVQADPLDSEAHFQRGSAAQVLGKQDLAEKAFRRCLELEPSRMDAGLRLALCVGQQGRGDEGLLILRRLVAEDPANVPAWNALGDLTMAAGAWNDAAGAWERSLGLQAQQAQTAFKLGFAYESLGRLEDAVAPYRASCRIGPGRLPVLSALASILERLGRFHDAVPVLAEACRLKPGDASLILRWARSLDDGADAVTAESALRRVSSDDPLRLEASLRLAWLLVRKGDRAGAEGIFRAALPDLKDGVEKDLVQGWLNQVAGLTSEALGFYRRAVAASPGDAMAIEPLANLLYRQGDLDGARDAYARLADLRPHQAEIYLRLGSLNLKLGHREAAQSAWERALQIDPGMHLARKNLAVLKG